MLRFWKKRRRPHGWRPPSFPARHRLCWRYDVCVRHDSHCPRDAQIREPPRNNYFLVIITFVMDPLSPLRAREGQAVVGPLLRGRSPTRSVAPKPLRCPALTPLVTLTRARGPGRGRPAATGSLANAIGRAKTAGGLGRASLRHFGLARGCRGIWRGVISVYWFRGELRFIGFGGAMLLDRDAARPDRAACRGAPR